ncbi:MULTISPECIES: C1 family peptidase [unclassified Ruegeria]|uniref:C1 family peptidase n=1 Tax=unclassified Ruegeria TaxID=2625375 RepID=UPI0014918216|nr:alpha/beta hydrolase [Ruegeria sp. HKCCD4318]NOE13784.1 alpha/beta hydrolase [Ruegeria sp. HKCCD4318-2]NOG08281.1 C1 family peptidase [Ruegeria sp. HKCCD4315]
MSKCPTKSRKTQKSASKKIADPSKTLDNAPRLGNRVLNALTDGPDLRDRIYEPALLDLKMTMDPPSEDESPILDQGLEGACTGFALSSAINLMNYQRHQKLETPRIPPLSSPRMLYEMAKINDPWPGEEYEGSTIRAALKGFYHNGVCSEEEAPYKDGDNNWYLKVSHAKDARKLGLGAYFRLKPEIIDYHAALNETGVIYVSARIHRGWQKPSTDRVKGDIKPSYINMGGHAFIIVGYDEKGFLIQNSWGEDWGGFNGRPGIARWRYEDWAETVMDAWVLRLSVPTPDAFDLTVTKPTKEAEALFGSENVAAPRQEEIIGHIIHLDDGKLKGTGKYPTPITTIRETAKFLADETATAERDYKHLMFYAHGGLNSAAASATRVRKMKEIFKRNGIYPIHFMWETGFFESLKDVIFSSNKRTEGRVGAATDFSDRVIEFFARGPGTAIWKDMKWDAEQSFKASGGGRQALKTLLAGNASRSKPLQIHLVGHSAGSILIAHLLEAMEAMNPLSSPIKSVSLMAPACTVDLYNKSYEPRIAKTSSASGITKLWQYNLIDQREKDDSVGPYRKSLLYFVSNAFEDKKKMPLLGMEKFEEKLPSKAGYKVHYAGRSSNITNSKTHGGFDNDQATMNDVLENILGEKPDTGKGFSEEDVRGY